MRRQLTGQPGSDEYRQAMAQRAHYVGSVEHKDVPSFAGNPPRPRPDATICDRSLSHRQADITNWLRHGILNGHFGTLMEGDFPRYVWYQDNERVYEGRLVNREQGAYKGYPLESDEWPEGLGVDNA
ncbi:hypothetical protein [Chromohalobacter sp. 48-RD10]|uniref:hypothetical protein n=1 Tax=Chromohalobacter sp. 48-RD10 TaxID=2994063 RepID=UPI0024693047|nr:hypothetical protein [Chromohalobacter sp. 48-RD10]